MFSVTYTGMCCLPLCTAIVRPTKSGTIVERRDQVLIGRLSLVLRALSTFDWRWWSTKGPFLIERDMASPSLFHSPVADDHHLRPLVAPGLEALGLNAPGRYGGLPGGGAAFAAAVRVIDRIHRHAAHRRAAVHVDLADLARAQAKLRVRAFARKHLHAGARRARELRALAWHHFDAV